MKWRPEHDWLFRQLMFMTSRIMRRSRTASDYESGLARAAAKLAGAHPNETTTEEILLISGWVFRYRPFAKRDRAGELKEKRHAEGRSRERYTSATRDRMRAAIEMRADGQKIVGIARRLGVTDRTINRYVSKGEPAREKARLAKQGCKTIRKPKYAYLRLDKSYDGSYVYLIDDGINTVKIGYTNDPIARRQQLQNSNYRKLTIAAVIKGSREDEGRLHEEFAEYRLQGEWFQRVPEIFARFNVKMKPAMLPRDRPCRKRGSASASQGIIQTSIFDGVEVAV